MLNISISKVSYTYISYYNKLVLSKNLNPPVLSTKLKKANKITNYIKKKKTSSNIVTLRAPKHFKVGRHHYHIITKYSKLSYSQLNIKFNALKNTLYDIIKLFLSSIKKKKNTKVLSVLSKINCTVNVKRTFKVI